MAFTVRFPTSGPCPTPERVAAWVNAHGEPYEFEGDHTLALRALPVQFVAAPDADALVAYLDVTAWVPLARLVDLLFGISVEAGADVRLAGQGEITRAALWMRLADEQDRVRIAEALRRAEDHGNRDEVLTRLWAVVATFRARHDDRWDVVRERIVEMREVGGDEGIDTDEASWFADDPKTGDVVGVPVDHGQFMHCLAWRWLNETYPGIAESHSTLH